MGLHPKAPLGYDQSFSFCRFVLEVLEVESCLVSLFESICGYLVFLCFSFVFVCPYLFVCESVIKSSEREKGLNNIYCSLHSCGVVSRDFWNNKIMKLVIKLLLKYSGSKLQTSFMLSIASCCRITLDKCWVGRADSFLLSIKIFLCSNIS